MTSAAKQSNSIILFIDVPPIKVVMRVRISGAAVKLFRSLYFPQPETGAILPQGALFAQ